MLIAVFIIGTILGLLPLILQAVFIYSNGNSTVRSDLTDGTQTSTTTPTTILTNNYNTNVDPNNSGAPSKSSTISSVVTSITNKSNANTTSTTNSTNQSPQLTNDYNQTTTTSSSLLLNNTSTSSDGSNGNNNQNNTGNTTKSTDISNETSTRSANTTPSLANNSTDQNSNWSNYSTQVTQQQNQQNNTNANDIVTQTPSPFSQQTNDHSANNFTTTSNPSLESSQATASSLNNLSQMTTVNNLANISHLTTTETSSSINSSNSNFTPELTTKTDINPISNMYDSTTESSVTNNIPSDASSSLTKETSLSSMSSSKTSTQTNSYFSAQTESSFSTISSNSNNFGTSISGSVSSPITLESTTSEAESFGSTLSSSSDHTAVLTSTRDSSDQTGSFNEIVSTNPPSYLTTVSQDASSETTSDQSSSSIPNQFITNTFESTLTVDSKSYPFSTGNTEFLETNTASTIVATSLSSQTTESTSDGQVSSNTDLTTLTTISSGQETDISTQMSSLSSKSFATSDSTSMSSLENTATASLTSPFSDLSTQSSSSPTLASTTENLLIETQTSQSLEYHTTTSFSSTDTSFSTISTSSGSALSSSSGGPEMTSTITKHETDTTLVSFTSESHESTTTNFYETSNSPSSTLISTQNSESFTTTSQSSQPSTASGSFTTFEFTSLSSGSSPLSSISTNSFSNSFKTSTETYTSITTSLPDSSTALSTNPVSTMISTSQSSEFTSIILSTLLSTSYTTWQPQTTAQSGCPINSSVLLPSTYNTFKCPNNTKYWPSYLQLNNSYLFSYPIRQLIACYGALVVIKCPDQQFIHIYSAYYGIQASTNFYSCGSSSSNYGTCFERSTTDFIVSSCEELSECWFTLLSQYIGDPCTGIDNRQLFIQYQCLDTNSLSILDSCPSNSYVPSMCPALTGSNQNQASFCEPTNLQITCASGTITILCAYYGIDPNNRCKYWYYGSPDACNWSGAFNKVSTSCNGRASCTINGNPSFASKSSFRNVCPSKFPYVMLFVQWTCSTTSQSLTTRSPSTVTSAQNSCDSLTQIEGSCPNDSFSPYEPEYLTNSSVTFFGYPIFQEIICEGDQTKLILKCPTNLVLHIYAGYFGIQNRTSTETCLTNNVVVDANWKVPTQAFISDAFKFIFSICESKNNCSILTTSNNLGGGNLYPSAGNQLLVQYQCVDSLVLTTTIRNCSINQNVSPICPTITDMSINDATWCDGDQAEIECDGSRLIEIVCAFYGIDQTIQQCDVPILSNHPKCYFSSSFDVVNQTCYHKNYCSFESFSTTFDVACAKLTNALYIQWRCV